MTVKRSDDRIQQAIQLRKVAKGLRKYKPTGIYPYKGQQVTSLQVADTLEAEAGRIEWILRAEAALTKARQERDANEKALWALVVLVDKSFLSSHGGRGAVLIEVGLSDLKTPARKTTAEQEVTILRRNRTRKILGTKGPKQKKALLAKYNDPQS